jgi:hypothetical protein
VDRLEVDLHMVFAEELVIARRAAVRLQLVVDSLNVTPEVVLARRLKVAAIA